MRLSVLISLLFAMSFTACSKSNEHSSTQSGEPKPPGPQAEGPLDLLKGNTTTKVDKRIQVEQKFADISLSQINSAKTSRIDFVSHNDPINNPEFRLEIEYEKPDMTGVATAVYPAVLESAPKMDGPNLILPGLRFNVPSEINENSRKQTLRLLAEGLEVIIPLKTERLPFCTSPIEIEAEYFIGKYERGTEIFKQFDYRNHTVDLLIKNLVTCGFSLSTKEISRVKNPTQYLKIAQPEFEVLLDDKLQLLNGNFFRYDGSKINVKLPLEFFNSPAKRLRILVSDPDNKDRFVNFTIYLLTP